MKKKGYKGSRCEKRYLSKCADGVAKTFTDIELRFVDLLQKDGNIKEFRCNLKGQKWKIEKSLER